jgi:glycosyltransferase involved in cell wall biosynthesis
MKTWKLLIVIPSYNTGISLLKNTVRQALPHGFEVLIVIDGSTDGSGKSLKEDTSLQDRISLLFKKDNTGKGDAVRLAATRAKADGFTHVLVMDADGQHPSASIPEFASASYNHPTALVMGQPVFGKDAPRARVIGRKLTTFWTNLETLWCGLGDTLFGMRVYPVDALLTAFNQTSFARGFDFDPEIAVRIAWQGYRPFQVPAKVAYLDRESGGVSHFNYIRDNLKLTFLHFRLVPEFLLFRAIPLIRHMRKWKSVS